MTAVKLQAQIRSTAGLQKAIEAAVISSDCPSRVLHVTEEIKELAYRLANGEPNDIAPSQVCEATELPASSTWGATLKLFEEQIDISERQDQQVDGLLDALMQQKDLYAPFAALERAAFDLVETDCPQHNAPVAELLPKATERAKELEKFTVSWDWKDMDAVIPEINRVLEPHGLRFEDRGIGDDSYTFELVSNVCRECREKEAQ
jgi:hypothetical protein